MSGRLEPVVDDVGIGRGKALANALRLARSKLPSSSHEAVCICERVMKTILCRSCGMTFKGRVRQRCSEHPNNIHLMDHDVCPNCKASQLLEFTEYEEKRTS